MFNSKEIQQEYVYHNKEGLTLFEFIWRKGREDALNIDMEKPMHFTDEQKAWVKNYIIINAKRQRADAIDECIRTLNEHASIPQLTSAISFLIGGLEQLKE